MLGDVAEIFSGITKGRKVNGEAFDLAEGEEARRMIFDVIALNLDDHGKNHAFQLNEGTRSWSLTPAYDLTFSPGILQRGMTVAGEVWPSGKTMEALCLEAGLTAEEYKETLQSVKTATRQWKRFAEESAVPSPSPQRWNSAFKKCAGKFSEKDRNERKKTHLKP